MQQEEAAHVAREVNKVGIVDADPTTAERNEKVLQHASTPHAPTRAKASASRRVGSAALTSRSLDQPVGGFSLRFNVASEPRKPYDALKDEHCTAFVRSPRFEKHWKIAQSANGRLQKMDDQIVAATRAKPPIGLPAVMRNPKGTLQKQLETTIQSRAKEEPAPLVKNFRIPYITVDETQELVEQFLHREKGSDIASQDPRGQEAHQRNTAADVFGATPKSRPLSPERALSPAQSQSGSRRGAVSPARRGGGDASGLLTDHYLLVLIKSEEITRKQEYGQEEKQRSTATRGFNTKLVFFRDRLRVQIALHETETTVRAAALEAERIDFEAVVAHSVRDRVTSAAREEIFPSCDIVEAGVHRQVDQGVCAACVADLRWTGSPDYCALYAFAFDGDNTFVAQCGAQESIRCPDSGNTVLRSWGDTRFSGTRGRKDQEPGQRASFEIIVTNLTAASPIRRFIFCVMNGRRTGASLSELHRAYFTLRLPEAGGRRAIKLQTDTRMREFLAVQLPDAISETALVVASFLWVPEVASPGAAAKRAKPMHKIQSVARMVQPSWAIHLHSHLRRLPNVLSYLRLPPLLESTVLMTEDGLLAELTQGRVRIRRLEDEAAEKLLRQGIMANEMGHWCVLNLDLAESATLAQSVAQSMYFKRKTFFPSASIASVTSPKTTDGKFKGAASIAAFNSKSGSARRRSSSKDPFTTTVLLGHTETSVNLDGTQRSLESTFSRRTSSSPYSASPAGAARKLSSSSMQRRSSRRKSSASPDGPQFQAS